MARLIVWLKGQGGERHILATDIRNSAVRPPLRPFGLRLHHDGCWSHEGQPILNRRLREKFDSSVSYLPKEQKYVVRLGRFMGEIEVEQSGFFVRDVNLSTAQVMLAGGAWDVLRPGTFETSPIDGALLCRVKYEVEPAGLLARFSHAAQAELFGAVEERGEGFVLELAGRQVPLPRLEPRPQEAH